MSNEDNASGPLGRYMEVLELVAAFPGTITLAEVSALLGLPKTSAHRLLKGLVRAGLAKDGAAGRTYDLGERLTRLLHATATDGWLNALAGSHLRQITDDTNEACYLTRLVGARVIVAISQAPDLRWRRYVQPGIEMPMNAAATSKIVFAYQPENIIEEALGADMPLLTAKTRNDPAWIREELVRAREQGYATCNEEIDDGSGAIAVPVILADGSVLHSLGITGPVQRILGENMPQHIEALQKAAAGIARAFTIGKKIQAREA